MQQDGATALATSDASCVPGCAWSDSWSCLWPLAVLLHSWGAGWLDRGLGPQSLEVVGLGLGQGCGLSLCSCPASRRITQQIRRGRGFLEHVLGRSSALGTGCIPVGKGSLNLKAWEGVDLLLAESLKHHRIKPC